jgi:hypothetical protein
VKRTHGPLDWPAPRSRRSARRRDLRLIESPRLGFSNPFVLLTLIGGLVAGRFFVNEARAKNPMVPLRLFRNRNFAGANILTLLLLRRFKRHVLLLHTQPDPDSHYSATCRRRVTATFVVLMFSLSRWSGA